MRTWRLGGALVALVLLMAACGGDDGGDTATTAGDASGDASTTAAPEPATTIAEDEGDGDGDAVGLDDMPGECRDAFVDYLRAIEPTVEGVDFEGATLADLEEVFVDLEPVLDEFDVTMEGLDCPDLDTDEATREDVIAFAQREAPGTVAFIEYSMTIAEDFAGEDGAPASGGSGDCETDIAAIQEYVDAGGTMADLTLGDLSTVGGLMVSVQENCPVDRWTEFFAETDVAAFLAG